MTAIVSGIYTQGKIELLEVPQGISEGKVRLIVIGETEACPGQTPLQYGKYRSGSLSTEDDFASAEWRGDCDWNNADGE